MCPWVAAFFQWKLCMHFICKCLSWWLCKPNQNSPLMCYKLWVENWKQTCDCAVILSVTELHEGYGPFGCDTLCLQIRSIVLWISMFIAWVSPVMPVCISSSEFMHSLLCLVLSHLCIKWQWCSNNTMSSGAINKKARKPLLHVHWISVENNSCLLWCLNWNISIIINIE